MRTSRILSLVTAVLAATALVGCDGLFEVENPTDIEETDLENPGMVGSLANSPHAAVAEYYDIAVVNGGLPGDEVIHASTNQGWLRLDQGTFSTFTQGAENLYNGMASAQWTARETTERLRELVDDPTSDGRVARGHFWDALARITLADLYERVTFDGGPALQPPEVYRAAIDILEETASIGRSAGDMEAVAAAEATMARAYRSLYYDYTSEQDPAFFEQARDHAQAALEAQPGFTFYVEYAQPGSSNGVYGALFQSDYNVMDPTTAYLEDPASGQPDPRVQHTEQQDLGSRGDPIFWPTKYGSRNDDIPVSKWEEPVLILAEYHLLNGELPEAVERINEVRTDAGLPEFSSDSAQEIEEQLIHERRAEFWLELRRWQDMRYYDMVPERWTETAQQQGVDRRFPISLRECQSNPNVSC